MRCNGDERWIAARSTGIHCEIWPDVLKSGDSHCTLSPVQRDWLSRGAGPQLKNFSKFLLRRAGVLFIFHSYEVASYAEGRKEVLFPLEELTDLLEPEIMAILKKA